MEGKNRFPPRIRRLSFDRLGLIWGEEKTTAFLQKFVKHVRRLIRCGEDEVARRENFAPVCFNGDLASAMEMRERGGPVQGRFSKTPGFFPIGTSACRPTRGIPTLATLLAGFLLSKEGQEIVFKMVREVPTS